MMQHDQLGLLENRLGSERYRRLIERLDATFEGAPAENTNESAALRMLAASEFFRTLVSARSTGWKKRRTFVSPQSMRCWKVLTSRACMNRMSKMF